MISQFLHLFRQRAVVESVRCLNYLSLSTIKPKIFVWYLTSHFSVPRWNLWSQISSGWMGFILVFNPFIWIRHVLHHVFTEFRFYWIFSQREACVSADTRIWDSSAYLNLVPSVFFNISAMKNMKSNGESTLPCGTFCFGLMGELNAPSSFVRISRHLRKFRRRLKSDPRIPAVQSFSGRPLCHTVSKAFSKSRFMRTANNLLFLRRSLSSFSLKSDLTVFFFGRNPSCSISISFSESM